MLVARIGIGIFIPLRRINFPINVLITNDPCQLIKKYVCHGAAFLAALLLTMSLCAYLSNKVTFLFNVF